MEQQREYYLNSGLRKLAVWCAVYLLFFRLSAIQQIIMVRGLQHLPAILGLAGALTTGGLYRMGLLRKPMVYWIGFWLWVAAGVPFSTWPGGTFGLLKFLALTALPVPFVIAGSVMTWKDCRRLAFAAAAAGFVLAVISKILVVDDGGGRAKLEGGSVISNSNDLAAILLLTMPFLLFVVLRPASNWFLRCGAVGTIAFSLYQTFGTGSRGGFVAICIMMLVILIRSNTKQRIGLIGGGALLLTLSFVILPDTVATRLLALSTDESGPSEANGSTEVRMDALKNGLKTMLVRPIFGCGAGTFPVFRNGGSISVAYKDWHEIHNAFVRAGAEAGLPALILFIAPTVWLFRWLGRVHRRARSDLRAKEIADLAHCFTIALAGFTVTTFFLPWQFEGIWPSISVFGMVVVNVAWRELSALGIPETAGMRRRAMAPTLVAGGVTAR